MLGLLTAPDAWAWGPAGHKIIARIAAARLTPQAARQVASLLDEKDVAEGMAKVSTWPDEINRASTGTASWHFMDVPIDEALTLAKYCPNNDCLVGRIEAFRQQLTSQKGANVSTQRPLASEQQGRLSRSPDSWSPAQQLSFLIHLVGDVHQPLHVATNGDDRAGNCLRLSTGRGEPYAANFHSFWDQTIVAYVMGTRSEAHTAKALAEEVKTDGFGTPIDWAVESHAVARKVYDGLKPRPKQQRCDEIAPIPLPAGYASTNAQIAKEQLVKAGVRLAGMLNALLN